MQQERLPGIAPAALPDGFVHRPGFLSPAEAEELRRRAAALEYGELRMRGVVARRQIASFGHGYAYGARKAQPGPPLPPFLRALRGRAAPLAGVPPEALAMAIVARYPPGAGIGWHRDAPAFGVVVGLSLGGPARFQLRRGGPGGERAELVLRSGDAYVLAGAARWAWQHHVPPVPEERFAVTFRTMLEL
jgi:alkylated DNA repair dioxygenase AlkB